MEITREGSHGGSGKPSRYITKDVTIYEEKPCGLMFDDCSQCRCLSWCTFMRAKNEQVKGQ